MCIERSVVVPEFIHDVTPSLGALSFFPTEWTDVLSVWLSCQIFSVHEMRCYDYKPVILEGRVCQRRV